MPTRPLQAYRKVGLSNCTGYPGYSRGFLLRCLRYRRLQNVEDAGHCGTRAFHISVKRSLPVSSPTWAEFLDSCATFELELLEPEVGLPVELEAVLDDLPVEGVATQSNKAVAIGVAV